MTQRHRTRPSRQRDPDQVETPFQYPTGSPPRGEFLAARRPVAPGCRHAAVGGIAAVLHVAEQQQAVPLRHKIDFAGVRATVLQDAMPGQSQIEYRHPFGDAAGGLFAAPVTLFSVQLVAYPSRRRFGPSPVRSRARR